MDRTRARDRAASGPDLVRDEIGETGPAEAEGAAPIGIWKPAYMTLSDVRPDFGRVSGSRTFSPNRPRDNA